MSQWLRAVPSGLGLVEIREIRDGLTRPRVAPRLAELALGSTLSFVRDVASRLKVGCGSFIKGPFDDADAGTRHTASAGGI